MKRKVWSWGKNRQRHKYANSQSRYAKRVRLSTSRVWKAALLQSSGDTIPCIQKGLVGGGQQSGFGLISAELACKLTKRLTIHCLNDSSTPRQIVKLCYSMIFHGPDISICTSTKRSDFQKLCIVMLCPVRTESHCVTDSGDKNDISDNVGCLMRCAGYVLDF